MPKVVIIWTLDGLPSRPKRCKNGSPGGPYSATSRGEGSNAVNSKGDINRQPWGGFWLKESKNKPKGGEKSGEGARRALTKMVYFALMLIEERPKVAPFKGINPSR